MSGVTSVRVPPGHFAEAFVVFCCSLLLTCKFRQTNKNQALLSSCVSSAEFQRVGSPWCM